MLVLSRRKGESIVIGNDIELTVLGVEGEVVKVGIRAPKSISIHRKEIYLQILKANQEAIKTSIDANELTVLFEKTTKNRENQSKTD